jgi:CBS domain-containing protein
MGKPTRRCAMRRWTVKDVMTKDVVSVGEKTPYKEIVEALAQHAVSAVPVVDEQNRVLGVVSEADLLHKMEFTGLEPHLRLLERRQRRIARAKAVSDVARDLMSSPAVTISPHASLPAAARMMDDEHVRRLPVVDERGHLIGIVSRSDVLRVYLRDDTAIANEIREEVLLRTLWIDPNEVSVMVERGVVRLSGATGRRSTADIIVKMVSSVAGVVDVLSEVTYDYDDARVGEESVESPYRYR